MNKVSFLQDEDVKKFILWSRDFLRKDLKVNLNITSKGTHNAGPINVQLKGLDEVTKNYMWRSTWKISDDQVQTSDNWETTSAYLSSLGKNLRMATRERDNGFAFKICKKIIEWGGDRNPNVGATEFLRLKYEDKTLVSYLSTVQLKLNLDTADYSALEGIGEMNAMLTKVHAIGSSDGLPIYDSRVAGAIACIIELYFIKNDPKRACLPRTLIFQSTASAERRQVIGLCPTKRIPGSINRGVTSAKKIERATDWSSAKIRLGWLMEAILEKEDSSQNSIFSAEIIHAGKAMHAFEAALFMIGFDVSCLRPNIT